MRATATFPYLTKSRFRAWPYGTDGKKANLTLVDGMKEAGLFDENVIKDPERNPFLKYLTQITDNSPKMELITQIMDAKGCDDQNTPAKVIFMCYSVPVALMLYTVSHLHFPS